VDLTADLRDARARRGPGRGVVWRGLFIVKRLLVAAQFRLAVLPVEFALVSDRQDQDSAICFIEAVEREVARLAARNRELPQARFNRSAEQGMSRQGGALHLAGCRGGQRSTLSAAPGARDSAVFDTLRGVETGELSGHKIRYQTKIMA
jgi:hypothetical protein